MSNRRTVLAVVLLLFAGGISAPALIGPMLARKPVAVETFKTPAPSASAASTSSAGAVHSRFLDVPHVAPDTLAELDPAPLSPALAAPSLSTLDARTGYALSSSGGGAVNYGSDAPGGRARRGQSGSGGSYAALGTFGAATPGLLGWGLSESRGNAAGFEVSTPRGVTSRLAAAGSSSSAVTSSTGSSGGGSANGGSSSEGSASTGGSSGGDSPASDNGGAGGGAAASSTGASAGGANGGPNTAAAAGVAPPTTGRSGGVLAGLGITPNGPGGSGSMPAATPEPATLLLVGGGAALAGLLRARRQSR